MQLVIPDESRLRQKGHRDWERVKHRLYEPNKHRAGMHVQEGYESLLALILNDQFDDEPWRGRRDPQHHVLGPNDHF